jgi:cell division septal protein FtsQ
MVEALSRLLKGLCKAIVLLLAIVLSAFTCHIVYGYMTDSPLLALREVVIEGCRRISERDILSMTQLDRRPNILSIKLAALRSRVETNPWIERAEIGRIFPDKISIKVTERRPAGVILLDQLYYIDAQGVIFARVPKGFEIEYPILTGLHRDDFKTHPQQAWKLVSRALRATGLLDRGDVLSQKDISEIHVDKASGITIYTDHGAVGIILGFEGYEAKWKRLVKVWKHLRQEPLKPAYIDCNYEKWVIVRMRDTHTRYLKGITENS